MPLQYAGPKLRTVAFLVDWAVLCVWLIALALVERPWVWYVAVWPAAAYFVLLEGGAAQASWGKQQLRLKVMEKNGRRVTWPRAAFRTLLKAAPWAAAPFLPARWLYPWCGAWIALALLSMLAGRRRQSWYDRLSGTAVICLPPDQHVPSPSAGN